MTKFLPDGYEVPQQSANYMKLVEGENRFRVLESPILGYEWWKDKDKGSKPIPMRITMDSTIPEDVDEKKVKHFWAMPVWDYKGEQVKILEITQKGIQKDIQRLSEDPDWGNPTEYDLVITRVGQTLVDTKYNTIPKPAKPLDPGIKQLFEDMHIDISALFRGGDPFSPEEKAGQAK